MEHEEIKERKSLRALEEEIKRRKISK